MGTKKCPYCAEDIKEEAKKCKHCGSYLKGTFLLKSWNRSQKYGCLAGVCAGIASQFGISVTLVRLLFVIFVLIGGWGLVIYLVLWLIMPLEELNG